MFNVQDSILSCSCSRAVVTNGTQFERRSCTIHIAADCGEGKAHQPDCGDPNDCDLHTRSGWTVSVISLRDSRKSGPEWPFYLELQLRMERRCRTGDREWPLIREWRPVGAISVRIIFCFRGNR